VSLRRGVLLLASVLLLQACAGATGDDGRAATGPHLPERTLATLDGGELSLPAAEGQPQVVNLWASWCPPCVAEMPDLERVHLDVAEQVRFLGINTQDELDEAEALVARTGVTYDIGLDPDGALFGDLEVVSMPSTFLVDGDGVIVHRHAGLLTEGQLRDLLAEHLGVTRGVT
jgi:DsbE subfamily thiol:disulfide oxidoreductase